MRGSIFVYGSPPVAFGAGSLFGATISGSLGAVFGSAGFGSVFFGVVVLPSAFHNGSTGSTSAPKSFNFFSAAATCLSMVCSSTLPGALSVPMRFANASRSFNSF